MGKIWEQRKYPKTAGSPAIPTRCVGFSIAVQELMALRL